MSEARRDVPLLGRCRRRLKAPERYIVLGEQLRFTARRELDTSSEKKEGKKEGTGQAEVKRSNKEERGRSKSERGSSSSPHLVAADISAG